MNIVFYTSGLTGTGRLVLGLSIGNALERRGANCSFTLVSGSSFGLLAGTLGMKHVEIPLEDESALSADNFPSSVLYKTLTSLRPDILIVDLAWFPLHHMMNELPGKKILLMRQVSDRFFSVPMNGEMVAFDPSPYDRVFAIEPWKPPIPMDHIDPLVLRNHDEIMPRDMAMGILGLREGKPVCLICHNGEKGEFEDLKRDFSYMGKQGGYRLVYSSNYHDGLFPVVDYFNAFDHVVCGGGYNAFWEAVYFGKEATFVPMPRRFEDQQWRVNSCSAYRFRENGADRLVDMLMSL